MSNETMPGRREPSTLELVMVHVRDGVPEPILDLLNGSGTFNYTDSNYLRDKGNIDNEVLKRAAITAYNRYVSTNEIIKEYPVKPRIIDKKVIQVLNGLMSAGIEPLPEESWLSQLPIGR